MLSILTSRMSGSMMSQRTRMIHGLILLIAEYRGRTSESRTARYITCVFNAFESFAFKTSIIALFQQNWQSSSGNIIHQYYI